MSHPTQFVELVGSVLRFKANSIILYLRETGRLDMNEINRLPFSAEDRQQLAQLLGYSVDGYLDLPYVNQLPNDLKEQLERAEQSTEEYLPKAAPTYWEYRAFHGEHTVKPGWGDWERVIPKSSLQTVRQAVSEIQWCIDNGYKYQLRALYAGEILE